MPVARMFTGESGMRYFHVSGWSWSSRGGGEEQAVDAEWRADDLLSEPAEAEDPTVGRSQDDAWQAHGPRLHDDPHDAEHHRELVGDELAGGPKRAHERVLVGRRPPGH